MSFGRLVTAMCTPFTPDYQIDWNSLAKLIDHLIETGTDTIVVAGTTAESPTLSKEEKLELFRFTVKQVGGRGKVIAGTGSNNTAETVEFTKKAETTGVDGVMVVAPYYNKPSQEGLYQHFRTVAEATTLPVMVYNVPGRTGCNLLPATAARLAQIPNVVAFKEASGNLSQISELIGLIDSEIAVYSGDDSLTLPILAVGGAGVVSVASHVIGNQLEEMMDAFFAGEVKEAAELHRKYQPVMEGLFMTSSPVPLKYALSHMELTPTTVRLPLVEMSEEEKEKAQSWLILIEK
ncbi:4-hydroxy-tetrahydrodipicolinate synthase [Risungbinella massiliensis]|uniref:4-hydroxy-tetrahydrodipicolinate synthase n=1 Tax=Risungbinella massiliensis TaxID=1329796 RepID=UPI0005CC4624|nr:4-hydroxy-tetrahydrodipicolinate synthase [Risungbinella massiliensis]